MPKLIFFLNEFNINVNKIHLFLKNKFNFYSRAHNILESIIF